MNGVEIACYHATGVMTVVALISSPLRLLLGSELSMLDRTTFQGKVGLSVRNCRSG